MPLGDTIAAVSSAPGRSARTLIRVSGSGAHALPIVSSSPDPANSRVAFDRLHLNESLSLPVLTLRFFAPRSSTGEDTLEILIPGNPALVDRVLAAILRAPGVRAATPGEFTARAFLNGRLTLDEAEGVAATIAAESDAELAAAKELLSGAAGDRARDWANELATLLSLVEASIDFTDQEDVVPMTPRALDFRLRRLVDSIASRLESRHGDESSDERPRVVLAGAPNAGKSTLFNGLLGRSRAVVSPIPGTTRDALEEPFALDSFASKIVTLVDLAGLEASLAGDAPASDHAAQTRARDAIAGADVLLWCDPFGAFNDPLLDRVSREKPTIRIRTKADLPGPNPVSSNDGSIVLVCGLDGYNLSLLRRAIADAALGSRRSRHVIPRHHRALSDAVRAMKNALAEIDPDRRTLADPALVAMSLREALDSIGEVTGRLTPDDIIGRIFATFCIGK